MRKTSILCMHHFSCQHGLENRRLKDLHPIPHLFTLGSTDTVILMAERYTIIFDQFQLGIIGHFLNVMHIRRRFHDPTQSTILASWMTRQEPLPKLLPRPVVSTTRRAASIPIKPVSRFVFQVRMLLAIARPNNASPTSGRPAWMSAATRHQLTSMPC